MVTSPSKQSGTGCAANMISVAFQGERGAFGDEAARAYFRQEGPQEASFKPHHSFADVFHAVSAGEVDYGIVPLEPVMNN